MPQAILRYTLYGLLALATLAPLDLATATGGDDLKAALAQPALSPVQASEQHQQFVLRRIARLQLPDTAAQWQQQAADLRRRVLQQVVLRGAPAAWHDRPASAVQWLGEMTTQRGYTIRKLRYEALPGLWIPALLYVPDRLADKVPVVLNVNGHEAKGKAAPYKQLRCINLAKRGMLALNVEWLGMGQLRTPGRSHNHLAKLDLCGCSGVGVFYLAMQRGLDVLLDQPHADPQRVAVTGLSGGGWQTIVLSSLDTRVTLCVPVAGYSALSQRVEHRNSIGDLEQNPSDLAWIADYVHLTALLAPRPALLIYNASDDCCFVSRTVKPNTFDPVVPFYKQAGAAEAFVYYENVDPGTHNYDLDNRQQLYGFLNQHFFASSAAKRSAEEIPSDDEIRSAEELNVELPGENADFHTLAEQVSLGLPRPLGDRTPAEQRELLRQCLRYEPLKAKIELAGPSRSADKWSLQPIHVRLGSEWVLGGAIVQGDSSEATTVLIADAGFAAHADAVEDLVQAGQRVVCLDPVLIGQGLPAGTLYQNAQLMATVGQRPLGVQTAQLLGAVAALAEHLRTPKFHLRALGPRCGTIALCAAALDTDDHLGQVQIQDMPDSFRWYLTSQASYDKTPEVYCFGLLEWFDVDRLRALW